MVEGLLMSQWIMEKINIQEILTALLSHLPWILTLTFAFLIIQLTSSWMGRSLFKSYESYPWMKSIKFWIPHLLFAVFSLSVCGIFFESPLIFKIFQLYFGVSLAFAVYHLIEPLTFWIQNKWTAQDPHYDHLFVFIKKTFKVLILILIGLMVLQNMGYNVTSLLAGLGIGGVAAALAAKDTLSNIFASFAILFDRPFVVGDWIQFDKTEGTVESIGFRSTQIKTFYDSVVSIPNFVLANQNVDNMGKRKFRRTRFTLGIQYSTPPEQIKAFIEGIKKIILSQEKTKKDYYQVSFSGYADSSLNIFVNLFLQVKNWNEELELRELIFLEILELAQKLKVEFAFPSQSLYIENIKQPSKGSTLEETLS